MPYENGSLAAGDVFQADSGVLESLVSHFEKHALLRVHAGRFPRRNAEEIGVEPVDSLDEAAPAAVNLTWPGGIRVKKRVKGPAIWGTSVMASTPDSISSRSCPGRSPCREIGSRCRRRQWVLHGSGQSLARDGPALHRYRRTFVMLSRLHAISTGLPPCRYRARSLDPGDPRRQGSGNFDLGTMPQHRGSRIPSVFSAISDPAHIGSEK